VQEYRSFQVVYLLFISWGLVCSAGVRTEEVQVHEFKHASMHQLPKKAQYTISASAQWIRYKLIYFIVRTTVSVQNWIMSRLATIQCFPRKGNIASSNLISIPLLQNITSIHRSLTLKSDQVRSKSQSSNRSRHHPSEQANKQRLEMEDKQTNRD
jgi:hypothetical protein